MISSTRVALLLSGCLLVGNTLASTLEDGLVYSRTGIFNQQISFSDNFRIDENGLYQATLTDFENTRPFTDSSFEVSSGSDSLGSRSGPGAFTFEAGPGAYAVSLFASVTVSDEEKEQVTDQAREAFKASGDGWWHSLTAEQKAAKKAMWDSWSDEQWQARREKNDKIVARLAEEQLVSMSQGEYGVEIAFLDRNAGGPGNNVNAVPVPAAAWLFISGLLGLAGMARKKPLSR